MFIRTQRKEKPVKLGRFVLTTSFGGKRTDIQFAVDFENYEYLILQPEDIRTLEAAIREWRTAVKNQKTTLHGTSTDETVSGSPVQDSR